MKKIITALLTVIILLSFSSCKTEYQEESHSIKDALKISAWVLNEDLDENGSWTVYENIRGRRGLKATAEYLTIMRIMFSRLND